MFLFLFDFVCVGATSERCVCCPCLTSDSATCSFWGMFLGCSILLVVPFELIPWTFAFQNSNRMDFVHLWMVYFGLLRWSTRKCKHTDCGEAGFLLKTSENNPWFRLVPCWTYVSQSFHEWNLNCSVPRSMSFEVMGRKHGGWNGTWPVGHCERLKLDLDGLKPLMTLKPRSGSSTSLADASHARRICKSLPLRFWDRPVSTVLC